MPAKQTTPTPMQWIGAWSRSAPNESPAIGMMYPTGYMPKDIATLLDRYVDRILFRKTLSHLLKYSALMGIAVQ